MEGFVLGGVTRVGEERFVFVEELGVVGSDRSSLYTAETVRCVPLAIEVNDYNAL